MERRVEYDNVMLTERVRQSDLVPAEGSDAAETAWRGWFSARTHTNEVKRKLKRGEPFGLHGIGHDPVTLREAPP
jgi:hypothetical protein